MFATPRDSVGLPGKGYYENKNLVAQYQDVIGEILGAIHPSKQARKQSGMLAKAVVDLESKLAAASPELKDLQDVTVGQKVSLLTWLILITIRNRTTLCPWPMLLGWLLNSAWTMFSMLLFPRAIRLIR